MCDQNLPMEILKKEKKKKEPSYGGFSLSLSLSLSNTYIENLFLIRYLIWSVSLSNKGKIHLI